MDDLHALVETVVPDACGPGVVVGVDAGGERRVVARGMADLDHAVPLTAGTVFHVASVAKQFTAGLVAHLAIPFDDPVGKWLPWFPFPDVRVAHLVVHTSGLRDHWSLFELGGRRMEDVLTTADAMRTLATQRSLDFAPGVYWCDEIEAHLRVTSDGAVALPGGPAHPATHAGEGWYAVPVPDREIGRLTLRVVSSTALRCSVYGGRDLLYRRAGFE